MKRTTGAHRRSISFEELPDWMTIAEVQAFLRLGRSTLYDRIHSGEIPCRRFGRQFRIAKEALRPVAASMNCGEIRP